MGAAGGEIGGQRDGPEEAAAREGMVQWGLHWGGAGGQSSGGCGLRRGKGMVHKELRSGGGVGGGVGGGRGTVRWGLQLGGGGGGPVGAAWGAGGGARDNPVGLRT